MVDIDPCTYTLDPKYLEQALTPRTKAIMPVHLYGQAADMKPILDFAKEHQLNVVEDAAQAHGAEYRGQRCGSIGDLGCFSFYPTKNLGAYGEGGIVTTNNPEYARKLRMLRDWGQDRKYHHALVGFNYRMQGIQGAILNVKLRKIEEWTNGRIRAAGVYDQALKGINVIPPFRSPHARHVYHTYTVRSSRRDELQQHLTSRGIQTAVHYPIPAHLQEAYRYLGNGVGSFPVAERVANEVLSLPMFAELTTEQIRFVASAIGEFHAEPLP
jgi:dTDP-4-amino-4,6-dideoxygalactose transaminase